MWPPTRPKSWSSRSKATSSNPTPSRQFSVCAHCCLSKLAGTLIERVEFFSFQGDSVDNQVRDKSLKYARKLLMQQNEPKDLFELPAHTNRPESDEEAEETAGVVTLDDDSNGAAGQQPGHQLPFTITNVRIRISKVRFSAKLLSTRFFGSRWKILTKKCSTPCRPISGSRS